MLNKIIKETSLSPEAQQEVMAILARIPEEHLPALFHLFSNAPCFIEKIYYDYCEKLKALSENDAEACRKIIQEEIKDIGNYFFGDKRV